MAAPQGPVAAAARKLDAQFERARLSLVLYGYSSEEIDRMLDDGVIARPKRWSRYYAESAPSGSGAAHTAQTG